MYKKYKTNKELKSKLEDYKCFTGKYGFWPMDEGWKAQLSIYLDFEFITYAECMRLEQLSIMEEL